MCPRHVLQVALGLFGELQPRDKLPTFVLQSPLGVLAEPAFGADRLAHDTAGKIDILTTQVHFAEFHDTKVDTGADLDVIRAQ